MACNSYRAGRPAPEKTGHARPFRPFPHTGTRDRVPHDPLTP
jgi:hypothetical protein